MREVGGSVERVGVDDGALARDVAAALFGHEVTPRELFTDPRAEEVFARAIEAGDEVDLALELDGDAAAPALHDDGRGLARDDGEPACDRLTFVERGHHRRAHTTRR